MRRNRVARALLLIALACLAAAPALAAPVRGDDGAPPAERPGWTDRVRETVVSLWERLRSVIGDEASKGDRVVGSGLDPDGHKPPTE